MSKSPAVEALRAELDAQVRELTRPLEGMRDYVRVGNGVNGEDAMRAAAESAAGDYQRRLAVIERVESALRDLEASGYPEIPPRRVPAEILAQLAENHATMAAALARFEPLAAEAVDGRIAFGTGALKDAPHTEPLIVAG